MLKPFLHKLIERQSLSREDMVEAMTLIMAGQASPAQLGAFLVALRMKGECADEFVGAASVMRTHATPIRTPAGQVIDTCGTGGDHSGSFNISTTTAFVIAACGAIVAKHGNHSNTSASGSADVLRALGVNIEADVATVETCLREVGIGFLYAPQLHQAMRHAGATRRELGIRSLFNVLGPLANPAGAAYQVVGVYDKSLIPVLVPALGALGLKGAMVVHGDDGLDELTTCALTHVGEWRDGQAHYYTLDARELGLARATRDDLAGGQPADNAAITRSIFAGTPGAPRDIVLLNTAAALLIMGVATDWADGLARAAAAIDSGGALAKLEALAQASHGLTALTP